MKNGILWIFGLWDQEINLCSIQKISSIHKFILKMQQILGSHELNQHLAFLHLYQHTKNQWPHPLLTMPTATNFNHFLICMKLYLHAKNKLLSSVHSWDNGNFRDQGPDWPHPFLTTPDQKIFHWGCFIDLFWRNSLI